MGNNKKLMGLQLEVIKGNRIAVSTSFEFMIPLFVSRSIDSRLTDSPQPSEAVMFLCLGESKRDFIHLDKQTNKRTKGWHEPRQLAGP